MHSARDRILLVAEFPVYSINPIVTGLMPFSVNQPHNNAYSGKEKDYAHPEKFLIAAIIGTVPDII